MWRGGGRGNEGETQWVGLTNRSRQRMRSDQEVFEDAFVQVAGSVLGNRTASRLQDERLIAKQALDEILKYYHYKPAEPTEDIRT